MNCKPEDLVGPSKVFIVHVNIGGVRIGYGTWPNRMVHSVLQVYIAGLQQFKAPLLGSFSGAARTLGLNEFAIVVTC